jgi:hypothetical protein
MGTRRPLIVQMVHDPAALQPRCRLQDEEGEEFGPVVPESAIADAIVKRTQDHLRALGGASVSAKPIVMRAECVARRGRGRGRGCSAAAGHGRAPGLRPPALVPWKPADCVESAGCRPPPSRLQVRLLRQPHHHRHPGLHPQGAAPAGALEGSRALSGRALLPLCPVPHAAKWPAALLAPRAATARPTPRPTTSCAWCASRRRRPTGAGPAAVRGPHGCSAQAGPAQARAACMGRSRQAPPLPASPPQADPVPAAVVRGVGVLAVAARGAGGGPHLQVRRGRGSSGALDALAVSSWPFELTHAKPHPAPACDTAAPSWWRGEGAHGATPPATGRARHSQR